MTQEEKAIQDNKEALQLNCDELYNACSEFEKKFVDAYVKRPNKAKAAEAAGSTSKDNASQVGWNTYSRPHVKAAITALQDMLSVSTRDVIKMVKDISESNLTDYYTKTIMVRHRPELELTLKEYIRHMNWQIEDACLLYSLDFYDQERTADIIRTVRYARHEIIFAEIEMRRNPFATRVILGPETLVPEKVLNIDDLIADKERGRVKKVKINKDGSSEFELYSADAAHERLLRRAGEYEADHKRTVVVAKPVIMDWGDGPEDEIPEVPASIVTNPEIIE